MNKQHTPGPWFVGGHPRDDSGSAWREILQDTPFGPAYIGQALEPDARLMAAAPELLAALEMIVKAYPGAVTWHDAAFIETARYVIVKAKGE